MIPTGATQATLSNKGRTISSEISIPTVFFILALKFSMESLIPTGSTTGNID